MVKFQAAQAYLHLWKLVDDKALVQSSALKQHTR